MFQFVPKVTLFFRKYEISLRLFIYASISKSYASSDMLTCDRNSVCEVLSLARHTGQRMAHSVSIWSAICRALVASAWQRIVVLNSVCEPHARQSIV